MRRQDAAAVHVIDSAGMTPIPFEQIGEWATVTRESWQRKERQVGRGGADAPVLAGMTMIDTPGVGGLDAGHGQAALESLRHADALVFVSNAGSHFTAPGAPVPDGGRGTHRTVILVLTRADLAKDVEAVKAKNVELLARTAPRFSRRADDRCQHSRPNAH